MSVIDTLRDLGGCAGGQVIYAGAKKLAQISNIQRKKRKLKPLIKSRLRPLFPIVDLSEVRISINCTLPANWFEEPNKVSAMTFGKRIYFDHSNIQQTESGIRLLVHELQHVSQVIRYGDEDAFACKYGEGYLEGGSYEKNPLEIEAKEIQSGWLPDKKQVAYLDWWEDRNFKGKHHKKYLTHFPKYMCHKLVYQNKMKSLKFKAPPGWKIYLFDADSCSNRKNWAEVIFPNDSNVKEVAVPRLGKKGQNLVKPKGCYKIHRGGVGGLVSSIRIFSNEKPGLLEWWEDRNFTGKKHRRYLYPSENNWGLLLRNRGKMKSCKYHGFPGWHLELYDYPDCSKLSNWAEIEFPNDPNVKEVIVPRLGKKGEDLVRPGGCYKIYGGGVGGFFSSFKHIGP